MERRLQRPTADGRSLMGDGIGLWQAIAQYLMLPYGRSVTLFGVVGPFTSLLNPWLGVPILALGGPAVMVWTLRVQSGYFDRPGARVFPIPRITRRASVIAGGHGVLYRPLPDAGVVYCRRFRFSERLRSRSLRLAMRGWYVGTASPAGVTPQQFLVRPFDRVMESEVVGWRPAFKITFIVDDLDGIRSENAWLVVDRLAARSRRDDMIVSKSS